MSNTRLKPVRPRFRLMERVLLGAAGVLSVLGCILLLVQGQLGASSLGIGLLLAVAAPLGFWLIERSRLWAGLGLLAFSSLAAWWLLTELHSGATPDAAHVSALLRTDGKGVVAAFWCFILAAWLYAWASVEQFAHVSTLSRPLTLALEWLIPAIFGVWLLILWEVITRGLAIPSVLLPPPSQIAERFVNSTSILWADFRQTFLKAVLIGYAVGCGLGFLTAIAIDRSPFLQRGLLPIGNLVSALPIVGVAPIMVMWFGFDWPSKAAVVIIMTFFPMLVNTVAGLSAASPMQHDLMKTYAADYWQSLWKLRLPEALPFIFNALKINSTLALIGAIVAEFFGTPIVGMGFRISTEVGRMNVDMVWAEIAVAALAGSLFYGLLSMLERWATFWHPSMRNR